MSGGASESESALSLQLADRVTYLLGFCQYVVVWQRRVTVRDVVLTVGHCRYGVVHDQQLLDVTLHHDTTQKQLFYNTSLTAKCGRKKNTIL